MQTAGLAQHAVQAPDIQYLSLSSLTSYCPQNCTKYAALLCREEEEAEYGARVEMNQTAVETLKMFHSQHDLDTFLASSQASTAQ